MTVQADIPALVLTADDAGAVRTTLERAARLTDDDIEDRLRLTRLAAAMLAYRMESLGLEVPPDPVLPPEPQPEIIWPTISDAMMADHFILPAGLGAAAWYDTTPDDYDRIRSQADVSHWDATGDVVSGNNIALDVVPCRDLLRSWVSPVAGDATIVRDVAMPAESSVLLRVSDPDPEGAAGPILSYYDDKEYAAVVLDDAGRVVMRLCRNGAVTEETVRSGVAVGCTHEWRVHRSDGRVLVELDNVPICDVGLTAAPNRLTHRWGFVWLGSRARLHHARLTESTYHEDRIYVDPDAPPGGDGSLAWPHSSWDAVSGLLQGLSAARVCLRRGSTIEVAGDTTLTQAGDPADWDDVNGFLSIDAYGPSQVEDKATLSAWRTIDPQAWRPEVAGEWVMDDGNPWLVLRVDGVVCNGSAPRNRIDGVSPAAGSLKDWEYECLHAQTATGFRTVLRLPAGLSPADVRIEATRPTGWLNVSGADGVCVRNVHLTGFSWSRAPLHHGYRADGRAGHLFWAEHVSGDTGHSLAAYGGQGTADKTLTLGQAYGIRQWHLEASLMDWRAFGSTGPWPSSAVRGVSLFNLFAHDCFTCSGRGGDYEVVMAGPGDKARVRFLIQARIGWPPEAGQTPPGPHKPTGFGMHPSGINSDSADVDAAWLFSLDCANTQGGYANGAKCDASLRLFNVLIGFSDPQQMRRMQSDRRGLVIVESRSGYRASARVSHVTMGGSRFTGDGYLTGLATCWIEDPDPAKSRYPETLGTDSQAELVLTDSVLTGIAGDLVVNVTDRGRPSEALRPRIEIDRNVYHYAVPDGQVVARVAYSGGADKVGLAAVRAPGGWSAGGYVFDAASRVTDDPARYLPAGPELLADDPGGTGDHDGVFATYGVAALDLLLRPRVNNRPGAFD